MKITTKGQVTIPLAIRRHLGLVPQSEVDFKIVGSVVQLTKARAGGRGRGLVARLRKKGDVQMTTDQILALTRR
jgi:AbrB family looped-hinge helix DNA binding protein